MHLSFKIRCKGRLGAPPHPSSGGIVQPYSSPRTQKLFLASSWSSRTLLLVSTDAWRSTSRRLWMVSLNGSSNSSKSEAVSCSDEERSSGAGEGMRPCEQQFRLSLAAKQVGQAVVGSLLGLAILFFGPDIGLAEVIPFGLSSSHGCKPSCSSAAFDNPRGIPHLKYLLGMSPANARVRRCGSDSPHPGMMSRQLISTRKEVVHEGNGDSLGVTYGQILQGRDDITKRQSMYTEDAWVGMVKLRQYDELLVTVEAEEKLCPECTKNRR